MNSNASQFSQSSPSTPLEAAALKAVRSKRQRQLNMHHAPTIDEQLTIQLRQKKLEEHTCYPWQLDC
jgi:hypothetical protein